MGTLLLVTAVLGVGPGSTVLPFLKAAQGPRAAGMGEAYTSIASDPSATYWNPAGLAGLAGYRLAVSHHQWFGGLADELLHGTVKAGPGAVGLGVAYSRDGGYEEWSESNEQGDTFAVWDGLLAAGYGLKLGSRYSLGGAVEVVTEDLYQAQGWGAGAVLGFLLRPVERLSVGAALRHLGVTSFPAGVELLPGEFAAGVSYVLPGLTAALDVVVPYDNVPNVRLGLEYSPLRQLALRAGYRTGPQDINRLGLLSGLTAGLGAEVGNVGLDYAFAPYGELGTVHRLGLRFALERIAPPTTGDLSLKVLDADSRSPVTAILSVSGVLDTAATAAELARADLKPGLVMVRAACSQYRPAEDTLRIIAGRTTRGTILIERLKYGEMKGTIRDAGTREPISGRVVYRGPAFGDQPVGPTGSWRVRNVPAGEYRLGISGPSEEYMPQACTLAVLPGATTERDFFLVKKRQTIVLEGINFETGKADILPQFTAVLDRAGEILKNTPDIRVELAGHTDPREINTQEFPSNWELSQARADAVRQYLITKFTLAPERLTARGYADTQPIAPNDSEEGMARNRRTEFRVNEE